MNIWIITLFLPVITTKGFEPFHHLPQKPSDKFEYNQWLGLVIRNCEEYGIKQSKSGNCDYKAHPHTPFDSIIQKDCPKVFKSACEFHLQCDIGIKFSKEKLSDCDSLAEKNSKICCNVCRRGKNDAEVSRCFRHPQNNWDAIQIECCIEASKNIKLNSEDNCDIKKSGCQHKCSRKENETEIICSCRDGYLLDKNGKTCLDIDECKSEDYRCPNGKVCWNIQGSFVCLEKTRNKPNMNDDIMNEINDQISLHQRELASNPESLKENCSEGLIKDESNICVDIDECSEGLHNCNNNTQCVNYVGGFKCQIPVVAEICGEGFISIGNECLDINECDDQNICPEGNSCENYEGGHLCQPIPHGCKLGYFMNANKTCEDVDECEEMENPCMDGFACNNTNGDYDCFPMPCGNGYERNLEGICDEISCDIGFAYHNFTGECEDINECLNSPCLKEEECHNEDGGYNCIKKIICNEGEEINKILNMCVDIDECTQNSHNCSSIERCVNSFNGFYCNCNEGYIKNVKNECVDQDECQSLNSCNTFYEDCINIPGSYECKCKKEFERDKDGQCVDINECKKEEPVCGREKKCTNLNGGFQCECDDGFKPNGDKCEDIDECQDPLSCNGFCKNTNGSFECDKCPDGTRFEPMEQTCKDVNECEMNLNCENDEICSNYYGGYKCTDISCRENYKRVSRRDKTCIKNKLEIDGVNPVFEKTLALVVSNKHKIPTSGLELYIINPPDPFKCEYKMEFEKIENEKKKIFKLSKMGNSAKLILKPITRLFPMDYKIWIDCMFNEAVLHRSIINLYVFNDTSVTK